MLFFKKKQSFPNEDLQRWSEQGVVSRAVQESKNNLSISTYPEVVQQIHNEFFTAGDLLLKESMDILNACAEFDKKKPALLKELGFMGTPQVVALTEVETKEASAQQTAKLVNEYRVKYPAYKFITEDMVKTICLKYSLVCGDVGLYRGFVPEKNLTQIKNFKEKVTLPRAVMVDGEYIVDISKYTEERHNGYVVFYDENRIHCFQQNIGNYDGVNFYGCVTINGVQTPHTNNIKIVGLQICAPIKEMNTEGMELKGYKLIKHIPDPVVLQPIHGGYLIVTAWGDEASDEMVINHAQN